MALHVPHVVHDGFFAVFARRAPSYPPPPPPAPTGAGGLVGACHPRSFQSPQMHLACGVGHVLETTGPSRTRVQAKATCAESGLAGDELLAATLSAREHAEASKGGA